MTHVVVSRLKNARLASEQHLCNVLLLFFFETAAGQKSALWSLKVWHWGTKLGISIKSSDTSVPSGRRKKSYTHSNLTSGVNEVSAYFHYLGHRCLRHHALQLTAAMTTAQLSLFFFSTLPIHVINLILISCLFQCLSCLTCPLAAPPDPSTCAPTWASLPYQEYAEQQLASIHLLPTSDLLDFSDLFVEWVQNVGFKSLIRH